MSRKTHQKAKKPKPPLQSASSTSKNNASQQVVRTLKKPTYKTFRLTKRIKHEQPKIPSARKLLLLSLKHLYRYKLHYLGIIFIYMVLTLVFVRGFNVSSQVTEIRSFLTGNSNSMVNTVGSGILLFGVLVGSAGSTASDVTSLYQTILLIIVSLAAIWTLRQTHAGNRPLLRDMFYKSMYPLVPFILVLLVIGLQLVPLGISNYLFAWAFNGIAVTAVEQAAWLLLVFLIALLSFYMISSSVFALYIVTLPDMTPIRALKSARELVRYRRWTVLRKVIVLPILLIIVGLVIMVPLIILSVPFLEWLFLFLTMGSVVIVHAYMYELYRELL